MDIDQALRLIAIFVSWPVVAFVLALAFRNEILGAGKWLAKEIHGRRATIGRDGIILGEHLGSQATETLAPREADAIAFVRSLDEHEPGDREILREVIDHANRSQIGRASRIAERAKQLLATPETVFPVGSDVRLKTVTLAKGLQPLPLVTLHDPLAGDFALAWLWAVHSDLGAVGELSREYADWVKAAELMRADGLPARVPPFTEEEFTIIGQVRDLSIRWTLW